MSDPVCNLYRSVTANNFGRRLAESKLLWGDPAGERENGLVRGTGVPPVLVVQSLRKHFDTGSTCVPSSEHGRDANTVRNKSLAR
jgi:hypothetical protein